MKEQLKRIADYLEIIANKTSPNQQEMEQIVSNKITDICRSISKNIKG